MEKFMLMIDYCAGAKQRFDFVAIDAKTILEAMDKAQDIAKEKQDEIYLIKILEKSGNIRKALSGMKAIQYHSILVSRGALNRYDNNYFYNFHTIRNGENETVCTRYVGKYEEFTTIECCF